MFGQWTRSVSIAQTFSGPEPLVSWNLTFILVFANTEPLIRSCPKRKPENGIIRSETWQSVSGTRADTGRHEQTAGGRHRHNHSLESAHHNSASLTTCTTLFWYGRMAICDVCGARHGSDWCRSAKHTSGQFSPLGSPPWETLLKEWLSTTRPANRDPANVILEADWTLTSLGGWKPGIRILSFEKP